MFILNADQVIPCQAIRRRDSQVKSLVAIRYRYWLFVKGESYPVQEKKLAIKQAREKMDAGQECIIVIDPQENYVLCYHDQDLQPLKENSNTGGQDLEKIVEVLRNTPGLIKNNRHKLRVYPRSLLGNEMVTRLCEYLNCSRAEAVKIGQALIDQGWLHHTWDDHAFKDEPLLYRFLKDEKFSIPFVTK